MSRISLRSAYMWTLGGNLAKSLIGFGLSILLARLLQPSDYGLVGMVLVVISILTILLDLGLGKAVVYFTEEEASLPVCNTVTVASGIILTAVSFWAAPLVADFYNDARLTALLRVLSVNLLLGSFRAVPLGKLTKHFRFREVTILETVSGLSSGIIAVLLAWKGFGVWSLVTNLLLGEFLLTVLVYFAQPVGFTLHLRRDMLKRLLRWGLPFTGSALLWQFYDNADKLIVGRMLGTAPLGFYSFASRLAMLPGERISAVINRVSFSSFSAIKHQRDDVVRHWLSLTRKLALLVFPILMVLALLAEDFLLVVVNRKWLPAALPVKFLCFMVALKTVQTIMTTVVTTQGRTDVTLPLRAAQYPGASGQLLARCFDRFARRNRPRLVSRLSADLCLSARPDLPDYRASPCDATLRNYAGRLLPRFFAAWSRCPDCYSCPPERYVSSSIALSPVVVLSCVFFLKRRCASSC